MNSAEPRLWTAKQAGKQLSLSPATLKALARQGRVPAFMQGNKWMFPVDRLQAWIDAKMAEAEAELPAQPPRSERLADVNAWLAGKGIRREATR